MKGLLCAVMVGMAGCAKPLDPKRVLAETQALDCYSTHQPGLVVCWFQNGKAIAFRSCGDSFVRAQSPCDRDDGWSQEYLESIGLPTEQAAK